MADVIRIGTRGSLLATTQAGGIRDVLQAKGHQAELVIISTAGDQSQEPIADIGVGVFTAALREAIDANQVDMAVEFLRIKILPLNLGLGFRLNSSTF